ncbi:uncharacterized protein LOC116675718 isoform X1 [Etheostoma spectabile]|uniref:uncharacterized protein LOC116675718 isoform X1 n=1 Tax=Etheostoma spectabile TaxID=54343 RepID=UPI0013AF7870|nr:uncharacterized protein LOC116675718 isoform X1 [Etheostoma spectabile]
MADKERKSLLWDIRKSLLLLSPNELFQIATNVGPVPDKDSSELSSEDAEGCFEYIHARMYSKNLLDTEDRGLGELLALKDEVDEIVQSRGVTVPPVELAHPATANEPLIEPVSVTTTATVNTQPVIDTTNAATLSNANVLPENVQQMLLNYDDLSKKLLQFVNMPTPQATAQPKIAQPFPVNSAPLHSRTQPDAAIYQPPEKGLSLKDLPYIQRREFKVQGGQIGDHSSDISYNSVCRQMEEGVKDNFTDSEVVRGVLRIIKPGDFKDMLVNKEDMTVAELRGFLQSHLGERNSTELFQELMCAKQSEHETPQQFLYRAIGLKQRILFSSKQTEAGIKYSPDTVQDVFLHTVYQGIGHKHNDIRRELKPLLSDHTVTDETILKHVMKITSDESERQRRLGPTQRQKHAAAHSAQVENGIVEQPQVKKGTVEQKAKTDTVQQLTEKIDVLTKLVDTLAEKVQRDQTCHCSPTKTQITKKERSYGCPRCVEQGLRDCRHCFLCGEEGHRARGCLKHHRHQGNANRLLRGDRQ